MNREERGPWYLLTGLVLGFALAVLYARLVQPLQAAKISPSDLNAEYKDRQRALIASAFMATGSLDRAKARLALLEDPDVYATLARQAQNAFADGSSPAEAQALGLLSVALGQDQSAEATSGPSPTEPEVTPEPDLNSEAEGQALSLVSTDPEETPAQNPTETRLPATGTPSPSSSPTPTRTPLPSSTPTQTPVPGSPFSLKDQSQVCDPLQTVPLIQVYARDRSGEPLSGVEMIVNWEGGEQHFYTGLKPEVDPGYADYQMAPERIYTLRPAGGGQPVNGLSAVQCDGGWGAWQLVFEQP